MNTAARGLLLHTMFGSVKPSLSNMLRKLAMTIGASSMIKTFNSAKVGTAITLGTILMLQNAPIPWPI
ncbi:Uncharacterised protein [Vibrio cholerae]|uniref:Uncharacterized protein n=1 Tax=Vibrio cholerae TaxID=666 RepID=A0A655VV49_VIBCL|nr:Uncharacterised protein [Vibrio cholerae]CSB75319.1 Uncharacterised protein [Vibrio cholerae]